MLQWQKRCKATRSRRSKHCLGQFKRSQQRQQTASFQQLNSSPVLCLSSVLSSAIIGRTCRLHGATHAWPGSHRTFTDRGFAHDLIAVPACRPTGGNTGIPWGTGGVWLEPVDEEAALRTVDRLQQFWHKKGDGFGTLTRGGAHADPSAAVPPGDAEGHVSADGVGSDSEGSDRAVVAEKGTAVGRAVNAVCVHVACSPHAFCLVEELEAVLASYGKSRSMHFNRKPILVQPTPC